MYYTCISFFLLFFFFLSFFHCFFILMRQIVAFLVPLRWQTYSNSRRAIPVYAMTVANGKPSYHVRFLFSPHGVIAFGSL